MKRVLYSLVVAATFVLQSVPAQAQSQGSCRKASFSPEVRQVYGDAKTVLAKMEQLNDALKDRRVWGYMVETSEGAQVVLFKKADKGDAVCTVYTARSNSGYGSLRSKLDHAILANAGVSCIGEQISSILSKELGDQLKSQVGVAAPVSVLAAIRHSVVQQNAQYYRVTLLLLC